MRVYRKLESLSWLFSVCMIAFLAGCGQSSSDSDTEEEDPEIVGPEKELDVDHKVSGDVVVLGTAYDSRSGKDIKTVQFGSLVWMAENVKKLGNYTSSVCYDDEYENCDTYGRLFQGENAGNACPNGFVLPTEAAWTETARYLQTYPEVDSAMNFAFGGYCSETSNGTQCAGLDQMGYYIAGEETVASVQPGTYAVTLSALKEKDYVALRCISYSYIVSKISNLPVCDSASQRTLKPFYVMSEKSNYRCVGSRWVDDFTNDCKHVVTGTYAVYNDSMYICKYNEWELASISDSKDSCTADNDSTTYKFNGYYYACENEAWRKFNEIEMELGYCRSSIYGKIDTIFYKGGSDDDEDEGDGLYTYKDYTCDSTGWRRSVMKDYIGDCDSSRMYEEAEFHKVGFVCRYDYWKDTTVWDPFTTLETEIGVCSPKKIGRIDSTETGVIYYCDSTDWRKADINDFLGECTAKREKEVGSWLKTKYKCVDSSWVALRGVEAEYGLCTPSRTGEIDTLDGYAYVCKDSTWNIAKPADIGGVCDKSKEFKEIDVGSDRYYCEDSSWIQMTSIEKMHGLCRGAKIGKRVSYSTDNYYCDSKSGWRKMTALENRFGVCTDSLEGVTKMYSDSGYQCVSGTWSRMSKIEYLGTCDSTAYGKSVSYNGTVYVCRYTDWSVATAVDNRLGMCSFKILGSVAKDTTSGNYFTCYSNGWVKTDAEVGALGRCNSDTKIVKELSDGRVYYCQGKFWTEAKTVSALYGTCTAAMKLKKVEFKDTTYICDSTTYGSSWHALTGLDTVRYCGAGNVDDTLTYEREHYVCTKVSGTSKTSYEWRIVSIVKYLGSCTVVNDGEEIYNGLNYSACIDEEWVGQLKKNFTDTRDSKKYKVQEIDGSTWMAQNMNYAQADSSICVDDDEDTNCGESGRLYSFTEAETVCPAGWHLPDSTEWKSMVDYLNDLAHVNLLWGSYDDIYGLKISPTGYVLYYLQNGQDPMTVRENDDTGAYFWMPNGGVYYFGKKYTVYGTSEGLQRQSSRVLKAAVRCVMD